MIKIIFVSEGREKLDKEIVQVINMLNRIYYDVVRGYDGFVSEDGIEIKIGGVVEKEDKKKDKRSSKAD